MAIRIAKLALRAALLPGTTTSDVVVAEFGSGIRHIPAMCWAASPSGYAALVFAAVFGDGGAPLAHRTSDHAAISHRRALPADSDALSG